jgi:glucokinase
VVRTILGALRQGRASSLAHLEPDPNPEDVADSAVRDTDVAEAVRQGDALAIELVEEGARYMAAGLASVINFYNPPRIILGGGMVEKVPLYFERSAALGRDTALSVPRRQVDIVRAELGDNSGVVGAAMLATHRA